MFENLTDRFGKIFDSLKRRGTITEKDVEETTREIRVALLEADVPLEAVKEFTSSVGEKALGERVIKSLSPSQAFIKIVKDELVGILSPEGADFSLNLKSKPPANILAVGLQGSGKTTACAKLALFLKNSGKKVLLVSLDIYRPAAIEQLKKLAASAGVDSFEIKKGEKPLEIARRAAKESLPLSYDVIIYDSAGRLNVDEEMIGEIKSVKDFLNPAETILVVDSMIGQNAGRVASDFDSKVGITSSILSRIDGDSKGGAALGLRYATRRPIKFLSAGENLSSLEVFDPERIASRILDMGDLLSFVEKAQEAVDKDESERLARRMSKGFFNLNDYASQIKNIKKMGGFADIIGALPGAASIKKAVKDFSAGEKILSSHEAIINSMTRKERKNPDIINASRKKRIAAGSGLSVQQVNILLKRFKEIATMVKKTAGGNEKNFMRKAAGLLRLDRF